MPGAVKALYSAHQRVNGHHREDEDDGHHADGEDDGHEGGEDDVLNSIALKE